MKPQATMRKIHRWAGFFILGFTLFYAVTGLLLNHRREFGYFVEKERRTLAAPALDSSAVTRALAAYEAACEEKRKPTVVKVKNDGTVELLYGSHGVVTYVFRPGSGMMERIEKKEIQPFHRLNRLHKAARTSAAWIAAADLASILILVTALSALFLIRPRRSDWLMLAAGIFLLVITVAWG